MILEDPVALLAALQESVVASKRVHKTHGWLVALLLQDLIMQVQPLFSKFVALVEHQGYAATNTDEKWREVE